MTVRAVLLDLGDTVFGLGPITPALPDRIAAACVDVLGPAGDRVARKLWTDITATLLAAHQAGETREFEMPAMVARHLRPQAPGHLVDAVARLYWEADVERFWPPGEAKGALAELGKAGLRLCAVSNTTTDGEMLRGWLRESGLLTLFDATVLSVELGVRKPHPDLYREALARVGCAPGEAVFIGDRVREDVLGPVAAGMRAVLTHEFRQEPPGEAQVVAVIRRLAALQGVISSLRA